MLWGNAWGSLNRWGDSGLVYTATSQGVDPLAKDDTLYYARNNGAGIADLALDRSQYADNMVAGATWTYEAAPASRFNWSTSQVYEFDCDCTNTTIGRFFQYDGNTSLRIQAGGIVDAIHNSAGLTPSITLPGISGVAQRYVIAWAVEPNLATTGAGDALRWELRAWNVATGAYTQSTGTTAVRTATSGYLSLWASNTTGGNPFTGTPRAVRVSTGRFHSSVETREDFIARKAAPAPDGATAVEYPIVDPACALRDPGQFAGPVYAEGAASAALASLRLFSPLVNIQPIDNATFTSTLSAIPTQWRTEANVDGELCGQLLFKRPLPPTATHAVCRMRVGQTVSGTADRITVRIYSMNRPPTAGRCTDHTAAFQSRVVSAQRTDGVSGWLEFDDLELVRNSKGETWIGVSLVISGTADTFTIDAFTVEPIVV